MGMMDKLKRILKEARIDLDPSLFVQEEDGQTCKQWTLADAPIRRWTITQELWLDTHTDMQTYTSTSEMAVLFWRDNTLVINWFVMPVGIGNRPREEVQIFKEFNLRITDYGERNG
jgi:hypothetical protein